MELLVTRLAEYIVNIGWQIVFAHLMEREVPELLIVAVEAGVVLRVAITARIAHPNVIAQVGKHVACK